MITRTGGRSVNLVSVTSSADLAVSRHRQLCMLSDVIITYNCCKVNVCVVYQCWRMSHCFIRTIRLEGWQEFDSGLCPLSPPVFHLFGGLYSSCAETPHLAVRVVTTTRTHNYPSHCRICPVFEAFLYGEQKVGKCHLVFRRVRKSGKATVTFVMSVCPSVRTHGTTRLPLDGFSWNFVFEYF